MIIAFIIFTLICNVDIVWSNQEQCLKDDTQNCSEKREKTYSAELNSPHRHMLKTVDVALNNYTPCNATKCNCHADVITNDLKIFKSIGITKDLIKSVRTKGTKYQIISNRLYRDKDCLFPSRCEGIEHFLLKLVPKLPDTEFIVNTRDWPQVHKQHRHIFGPVFSFSKTDEYHDIMYPAWSFWEGGPAIGLYPRGLGRWDKHRMSVSKSGDAFPWEKKLNKGFFRGSRTSADRDPLILLSREKPNLVDAKYTKNQAWKSDADTLHAAPATEVSLEDHCKYKYLFNFRGVAASFRFKHLFLCKSLVFHIGDQWLEFFYPSLKPWVHYIPVHTSATQQDIHALIKFAQDNDALVKVIAERGFQHIWDNLKMSEVQCYWNKLLRKYTRLLKFKPTLDDSMIEIL